MPGYQKSVCHIVSPFFGHCGNVLVRTLQYLGHKDESHGEEAAEDVGKTDECEAGVGLVGDDEGDGGGDDAEHRHVVDGHPHQPAVIDLLHLVKTTFK